MWRYHSIIVRDLAIADSKLNAEGEKGWELVSVVLVEANTVRAFFKMRAGGEMPLDDTLPEVAVVGQNPFG